MLLVVRSLVVLAVVALLPWAGHCQEDAGVLLREFVATLDRGPVLADANRYVGPETEWQLEKMVCLEMGWEPLGWHCVHLTRIRADNDQKSPSLYLSWLRTKLPRDPAITILDVETHLESPQQYQLIRARLDEVEVLFFRNLNLHLEGPFGELHVREIDGVKVKTLLERDRENGFTPAVYLDPALLERIKREQPRPEPAEN